MRQLDTDLRKQTGLRLADFDVLAELAAAGGELRMTELAARTLLSRSGLTRRVARLVDEGLVRQRTPLGRARRGCRLDRCRCRTPDRNSAGPSSRCVETVRRAARRSGTRRSRDRSEKSHRRLQIRPRMPAYGVFLIPDAKTSAAVTTITSLVQAQFGLVSAGRPPAISWAIKQALQPWSSARLSGPTTQSGDALGTTVKPTSPKPPWRVRFSPPAPRERPS